MLDSFVISMGKLPTKCAQKYIISCPKKTCDACCGRNQELVPMGLCKDETDYSSLNSSKTIKSYENSINLSTSALRRLHYFSPCSKPLLVCGTKENVPSDGLNWMFLENIVCAIVFLGNPFV